MGWAVGLYAATIFLFSLPFAQREVADWIASILSDQIKAKVEIGSIDLGLLNRVIIDDVTVYEPKGDEMLTIARMAVNVKVFPLFSGKIIVNSAQLFGAKATLYKETPESKPNFQFIVDAFKSDDSKEPSSINLELKSLIVRRLDVNYDVRSEAVKQGEFDVNHLRLNDVGANLVAFQFTNDSLSLSLRRLQASELNSDLTLKESQLSFAGNKSEAVLRNCLLLVNHSDISIDSLKVNYANYANNKEFCIDETTINSHILLSDFAPFVNKLKGVNETLVGEISLRGNEKELTFKGFKLNTEDNGFELAADARIAHPLSKNKRVIDANISKLNLSADKIGTIATTLNLDNEKYPFITEVGNVGYSGDVRADKCEIASNGLLRTGAGNLDYNLTYSYENANLIDCSLKSDSLQIGKLIGNPHLGAASFDLSALGDIDSFKKQVLPNGKVKGTISNVAFNDYTYNNIEIDVASSASRLEGVLSIDDEHVALNSDFVCKNESKQAIDINLELQRFLPHSLNLTKDFPNENLTMNVNAQLRGNKLDDIQGFVNISDLNLSTPLENYSVGDIAILSEQNGQRKTYNVSSEFLDADIEGEKLSLSKIANAFTRHISKNIPLLVKANGTEEAEFEYNLQVKDSPILRHLSGKDFVLNTPVSINGFVNANEHRGFVNAPLLTYEGNEYKDVSLSLNASDMGMDVMAKLSSFKLSESEKEKDKRMNTSIHAHVSNNTITSDIQYDETGRNDIKLRLLPTIALTDSLGSIHTVVTIKESNSMINDTVWTASPAKISVFKNNIECHGLRFANTSNSVITIEGKASSNPHDAIVATLNNLEIKYILSIVNFNAVRFAGRASGKAVINNVLGEGTPQFSADLNVEDFTFQEGSMGNAHIVANWDKNIEGIALKANFKDKFLIPDGMAGSQKEIEGKTELTGWVSPAKNDIRLDLMTDNMNAAFLHGFLDGVFTEAAGTLTGPISIVGPLSDINLEGNPVVNLKLRLRATNVPYYLENETVHLRPYMIEIKDATMHDKYGYSANVNAQISHKNFKNFKYNITADMNGLCAYDETTFNSDKFYATVFANGNVTVNGSDGHPLRINADITPVRGSVFAYDAATPDAAIGSSFIEFHDRDSLIIAANTAAQGDSLAEVKKASQDYHSDIYLNANFNLTPDCEVKLRMDNLEDGYMRTYGNGRLHAQWYNKGAFQLFGNYEINSGSYRLYLQDIIFRDLAIQPNSLVEFNGNPFDANIHLICHHTINSVPLSDLTNTTAFSQNNKAKVVCILDITGKLGNMDFSFDMDLPNVNEEVRQLVRSMIYSEEEMNTQMIYLLGVGRFYPNEYARANGGNNSEQAVSSLLSSTISGQINQLLSSMIGTNSKWNLGSSLTTGENGWDDLDVEGILTGRLFDERLLVNGNFGYRDNALTNQANFIGDFEVKWKMLDKGNLYLKAYNQTNDRYFTKATINTQGLGVSLQIDFEALRRKMNSEAYEEKKAKKGKKNKKTKADDN